MTSSPITLLGISFSSLEKNIRLHFVDQPCDLVGADRTLMTGTQHASFDLGTVVGLPVVIFFDDNQRDRLYLFIGRKTFAAHIAYPTAANRVIIIGWTGINYSRIVPTAKKGISSFCSCLPEQKKSGPFSFISHAETAIVSALSTMSKL